MATVNWNRIYGASVPSPMGGGMSLVPTNTTEWIMANRANQRMSTQPMMSTQPKMSTQAVLGAKAPTLSSGGGFAPQQQPQPQELSNPFQGAGQAAFDQAQAELDAALTEYDRSEAELQIQRTSATGQKTSALSEIGAQEESAKKRASTLTGEAEEGLTTQKERALSTSQDVVRKNRSILRAMGILSSSAAGEMLARPTEEYAKVAADLTTAFNKRKGQIEDWLTERLGEADRAKTQIIQQFNDIIARIDSDLRFNQRDKVNAVKAANAALKENIAQLNNQALAYQQAAQQYTQNMQMQMAELALYQNPSANVSGILSSVLTPQTQTYKPITVGTLQPREKEGLLSGLG